jgi:hypothetical protein
MFYSKGEAGQKRKRNENRTDKYNGRKRITEDKGMKIIKAKKNTVTEIIRNTH